MTEQEFNKLNYQTLITIYILENIKEILRNKMWGLNRLTDTMFVEGVEMVIIIINFIKGLTVRLLGGVSGNWYDSKCLSKCRSNPVLIYWWLYTFHNHLYMSEIHNCTSLWLICFVAFNTGIVTYPQFFASVRNKHFWIKIVSSQNIRICSSTSDDSSAYATVFSFSFLFCLNSIFVGYPRVKTYFRTFI